MKKEYLFDKGIQANKIISEYLKSGENFSLCRLGLGEIRWIDWYLKGGVDFSQSYMLQGTTLRNRIQSDGVYGDCAEYFFEEYTKSMSTADLQVFWYNYDDSQLLFQEQSNIFNSYSKSSIKVACEVNYSYLHPDFWSKNLSGKKVLVIYPFVETIQSQFEKRDKIWSNEHFGKLPDFELKTYKPVWTLGGNSPHSSWKDSLTFMKDEISKIEFDVALLGCSHYGVPLVSYIKTVLNKTAIYMGGELQILFGIKGKRWDSWEFVKKHYNENWVRSKDEIPNGHYLLDGGCYW